MNYTVTLMVSKFGFWVGIGFVVVATVAGFFVSRIGGAFAGFLVSAALMVPFLMLCEGMHALVTIANNTKKDSSGSAHFNKVA